MKNIIKKMPIMWYEGMPLSQTAFQHMFVYNQEYLQNIVDSITPYAFGVSKLVWNDIYIKNGILQLKELECIFPDLTYTYFPIADDDNLQIDLNQYKNELKQKSLTIYIAISSNYCSYESVLNKARYEPVTFDDVEDLNSFDNKTPLTLLKHKLSLMIGDIPVGYIKLPLCRVVFNGLNFSLVPYEAPFLKLSDTQFIKTLISNIVSVGRDKLIFLGNKEDFSLENQILMKNLLSIVLALEQELTCDSHPYTLYRALNCCLSEANMICNYAKLPMIIKYDHLNQYDCMIDSINFIQNSVNSIEEKYTEKEFKEADGVFSIMLDNADNMKIGVLLDAQDPIQVRNWIMEATIVTEDFAETAKDMRVVGAARRFVTADDTLNLKAKNDLYILLIENDNHFITASKKLYISNSNNPNKPTKIMLFQTQE